MKYPLSASLFAMLLVLQGCTTIRPPAENTVVREYSLSSLQDPVQPARPARFPLVLLVSTAEAPSWFENPALYYRLAYRDGRVLQPYAKSRWVGPAAELLTQRLHAYLASQGLFNAVLGPEDGARVDYALRVTLEDFSQVFQSPGSSVGQVRARLTLVHLADQRVIGQRVFQQEVPAPSADARGGVIALDQASARLVEEVSVWLADLGPDMLRRSTKSS